MTAETLTTPHPLRAPVEMRPMQFETLPPPRLVLKLQHLSAGYGDRAVLHNVTLNVAGGEVVSLVGPNGAGKSTLIRAISGILTPRAGTVYLHVSPANRPPAEIDLLRLKQTERARLIAVVPQIIRLPEVFTVEEVVLMGRTPYLPLWGNESRRDREIAAWAMHRADVAELAGRRIGELSGGEQQRVIIARALAQQPQVLLLDEPTAHLDLKHQATVLELVRALASEEQLAVLMTMHDLNQAAVYADRVALMCVGEIIAQGAAGEVLTAEHLQLAYGVPVAIGRHPTHGTPLIAPAANGGNNDPHLHP